jgi:peptidoglycan/LPS O-acetylase OafA/YrhL
MRYRPEIDGLRAIAVLLVIFFHAGISWNGAGLFPGGFVGVDVFFVISGYLITRIILKEKMESRFFLRDFYERRARRILPALAIVLITSFLVAWKVLLILPMLDFTKSLLSVLTFTSNFYFWKTSDYFSSAAELKPLLHCWTLSVEEQFYFLFPPFLAWQLKRKTTHLQRWILALLILSLAWTAWSGQVGDASAVFFLLPTRLWELAAGALLATRELSPPRKKRGNRNPLFRSLPFLVSAAGLGCVFYSAVAFSSRISVTPLRLAVPVLGAVLILSQSEGIFAKILSTRILRQLGLYSYSLYLWHQPVLSFARIHFNRDLSVPEKWAALAITLLLAALSYHAVEKPARDRKQLAWPIFVRWMGAGTLIIAILSVLGIATKGFPQRFPPMVEQIERRTEKGTSVNGIDCHTGSCHIGAVDQPPSWAIVGDSHAGVLASSLDKKLKEANRSAVTLTHAGTYLKSFPAFIVDRDRVQSELEKNQRILYQPEISTVLMASRAALFITNEPFDNREGGSEKYNFSPRTIYDPHQQEALKEAIQQGILDLLKRGKKIVLIYPIPEVGWNVPKEIVHRLLQGDSRPVSTSYEVYKNRNQPIIDLYDSLGDSPLLLRIKPDEIFCRPDSGRCMTHTDSEVFYWDDNHLSQQGAKRLVERVAEEYQKKWGSFNAKDAK